MESLLQIIDFLDFEDLFKEISFEINSKKAREKLSNEDLVKGF
jgi:hypothetical protein